jgi:C-terminal processing protease CtpA/Prc
VPDAEVTYTKPVLMLINDQCYSCGDIFPALLQDNKRAKLFGTTTAGAGGAVGEFGPLSFSGSSISLTLNVMKRSNGQYIENVGITPEVKYEVTQDDVATNYRKYKIAYVTALMKMIAE